MLSSKWFLFNILSYYCLINANQTILRLHKTYAEIKRPFVAEERFTLDEWSNIDINSLYIHNCSCPHIIRYRQIDVGCNGQVVNTKNGKAVLLNSETNLMYIEKNDLYFYTDKNSIHFSSNPEESYIKLWIEILSLDSCGDSNIHISYIQKDMNWFEDYELTIQDNILLSTWATISNKGSITKHGDVELIPDKADFKDVTSDEDIIKLSLSNLTIGPKESIRFKIDQQEIRAEEIYQAHNSILNSNEFKDAPFDKFYIIQDYSLGDNSKIIVRKHGRIVTKTIYHSKSQRIKLGVDSQITYNRTINLIERNKKECKMQLTLAFSNKKEKDAIVEYCEDVGNSILMNFTLDNGDDDKRLSIHENRLIVRITLKANSTIDFESILQLRKDRLKFSN